MNNPAVAILATAFVFLTSGSALAQSDGTQHGMAGMGRMGGGMGGGMCAGGCRMMDVTPEPVDPKSLPEPQSAEAKLLTTKCTQCHGLVTPRQHAAQEWPSIVNRMEHRMQMMARGMGMMRSMRVSPLTSAEKATLLAYLERNSFRAAAPQAPPAAGDEPAQAFLRTCSRCHAPPDPTQHSPAEWDTVVSRMAKHMEQQGFGPLPERDRDLVLKYLSTAQKK